MGSAPVRVLLIEQNASLAETIRRVLAPHPVDISYTPEEGLSRLRKGGYSLALVNCELPRLSGVDMVTTAHRESLLTPIIILADPAHEAIAVEALKAGAIDYVLTTDALKAGILGERVIKALAHSRLIQERQSLLGQLREKNGEVERMNNELLGQQKQLLDLATELQRLNEDLRESDRVKSEIVSMVNHELRTPMTAVKEGIALILDDILGPVSEEQRKFLTIAKSNLERLGSLINRFLDWSKLEAGKMAMHRVPMHLPDLIKEIEDSMFPLLREKGLTLETRVDTLPPVVADRNWLIHVLTNLVANAIKFSPRQGRVILHAELVKEDKGASMVQIHVEDEGAGVPKGDLRKIFEAFYQVRKGSKQKVEGTGLGLFICQLVVERHGGRIWVESPVREGRGSRFSFTLPVSLVDDDGRRV